MRSIIRAMFAELTLWGRFWLIIGLGTLAAAGAMSFDFGSQVSWKHAMFLGLLSIITAFAPETAYRMFSRGQRGVAMTIAIVCAPLFLIEFYSHAGYTAGLRGVNMTEGKISQANWSNVQEVANDDKDNLGLWKKQLATLQEQAPWAATVTADGLRSQVENLKEAADAESRLGGCGRKCRKIQDDIAEISGRVAVAEQREDLTKRIEATQRILDKKIDKAVATSYTPSAVAEQNAFIAKTVGLVLTGSLKPSEIMVESAQQSISFAMALAGTGLPAFAFFLAGLYRRSDADDMNSIWDVPPSPKAPAALKSAEAATVQNEFIAPALNLASVTVGQINRLRLEKLLANRATA